MDVQYRNKKAAAGPSEAIRGRGSAVNPAGRFQKQETVSFDDGWGEPWQACAPETHIRPEAAKSIITRNDSPDIHFDRSINPYRGCEHGCVYCFARPAHAYVDLSPGLDFESQIFFKDGAAERLEEAFRRPGYRCRPIAMGTNTDPYQPAEKMLGVTRSVLEVMQRYRHPVTIVTKGTLIQRDLDLLADLAGDELASVAISVTTLDDDLKRRLEPRTPSGRARLQTIERLAKAGVPVGVMVAPVIPAINDREIEAIVAASASAGAQRAGYILLRLPFEVKALFRDWLSRHYPERAHHVMSLVRQSRDGRDNDPAFHRRMRGEGVFAELIASRFAKACREHGLGDARRSALAVHHFGLPADDNPQMSLL